LLPRHALLAHHAVLSATTAPAGTRLDVEQFNQRRAAGEDLPLVDVTLVGDLAGVKAGRTPPSA
jgi:hypothetical protein